MTTAKKTERKGKQSKPKDRPEIPAPRDVAPISSRANTSHYAGLLEKYAHAHDGDLARINALLSRCLELAGELLESEDRAHIVLDCAEKLTRTKARIFEIEMQQENNKRQLEIARAGREPIKITFDLGIKPMRTAPESQPENTGDGS